MRPVTWELKQRNVEARIVGRIRRELLLAVARISSRVIGVALSSGALYFVEQSGSTKAAAWMPEPHCREVSEADEPSPSPNPDGDWSTRLSKLGRWRCLAVTVPPPTGDGRIGLQSAGVAVPGINACEFAGGRHCLTNMIESSLSVRAPASHRAIRSQAAGVVQTGAYGPERPRRRGGLTDDAVPVVDV